MFLFGVILIHTISLGFWFLVHLETQSVRNFVYFSEKCCGFIKQQPAAGLRPNLLGKEMSPVLHAGGQGVHAGGDGADGETRSDNWVRVEEHRLDHIQNICVSVQVQIFTNEPSSHTDDEHQIISVTLLLQFLQEPSDIVTFEYPKILRVHKGVAAFPAQKVKLRKNYKKALEQTDEL